MARNELHQCVNRNQSTKQLDQNSPLPRQETTTTTTLAQTSFLLLVSYRSTSVITGATSVIMTEEGRSNFGPVGGALCVALTNIQTKTIKQQHLKLSSLPSLFAWSSSSLKVSPIDQVSCEPELFAPG